MISNWLWGGGGTLPASIPDDVAVVLKDDVPVDDVPEVDNPLVVSELLAANVVLAAPEVVRQLALPVAAWYWTAPASIPAGKLAPAQPLSSMPTPTGRPTSGVRWRFSLNFSVTISLPFVVASAPPYHTQATST